MVVGVVGSRASVIDVYRVDVMLPIIIDSVSDDRMISDKSGLNLRVHILILMLSRLECLGMTFHPHFIYFFNNKGFVMIFVGDGCYFKKCGSS